MKKSFAIAATVALSLSGCASVSDWLAATGPAPPQLQAYSCGQIDAELRRLQYLHISQLGGAPDDAAARDKALAAGSRSPWLALFFGGGAKDEYAELWRAKGEVEALQQLARRKQCEFGSRPPESDDDKAAQNIAGTSHLKSPGSYPSYTLLASGAVLADPPTVMTGAPAIPVRAVAIAAIFKKPRGDVCDTHVLRGEYCWWSPPGNYSMCPPMASLDACRALFGGGCRLGHGKVLPLC